MKSEKTIWTEYAVPETEPLKIKIGPAHIWCIAEKKELRLAWKNQSDNSGTDEPLMPLASEWQRWAFKHENPRIELIPIFPDRPVLVQPENSFKIVEDTSVRIYIRIPIWIRINLLGKKAIHLIEIPVVTLSNTWFGTYQEGDLCYWISSGARMDIEPDLSRPYMAICPLLINDRSPEDLNVEKICLRVAHLSLYFSNGQLWSNETQMSYKGQTEISQVDYSQAAPKEVRKAKLISKPRIELKKSIAEKTFSTIKDLPGFGLFIKE